MLVTRCVPGRMGAVGGTAGAGAARPGGAGGAGPSGSGAGKGRSDVGGSTTSPSLGGLGYDGRGDFDRRQFDFGLHRLGRERECVVPEAVLLELRLHDLRLLHGRGFGERGLGLDHGRQRRRGDVRIDGAGTRRGRGGFGFVGDRPGLLRGLQARKSAGEDAQRSRRSGGPTQPLGVIRLEPDLFVGRERGSHRATRCAELAGRPDLPLGVDFDLIAGGPTDGDGDHPDDGLVGAGPPPPGGRRPARRGRSTVRRPRPRPGSDAPPDRRGRPRGALGCRRALPGPGRRATRPGRSRSAMTPRGRWSRFDLPRLLPRFRLSTGAAGLPWPSP